MKTEKQIKDRLIWLLEALKDEDNQQEIAQVQLWAQIDFIRWLGIEEG